MANSESHENMDAAENPAVVMGSDAGALPITEALNEIEEWLEEVEIE